MKIERQDVHACVYEFIQMCKSEAARDGKEVTCSCCRVKTSCSEPSFQPRRVR